MPAAAALAAQTVCSAPGLTHAARRVALPPSRYRLQWHQLNLLIALCSSVFLSGCLSASPCAPCGVRAPPGCAGLTRSRAPRHPAVSVLAPVLPGRLDELSAPGALRAAIFGAYPLTLANFSLVVPWLVDRFGRKPLLFISLGAEGALVILFGMVRVHRGRHKNLTELWLMLHIRMFTGVFEAIQNTVLLLYAVDEFDEQGSMGTVMGWEESCAGLGIIFGPTLSLLVPYGYSVPFVVLGLLFLALLPLLPFALRHTKQTPRPARRAPRPPWRAYLRYDIVNAAVATFVMGACFGVIMPTLSAHLQMRLGVSKHWVGLVYMIPALVYGISCPLAGIVADKYGYRRLTWLGFSLLSVAFFMMGPLPVLKPVLPQLWVPGHPAAWAWAIAAMVFFGVGGALGFVPTMPAMLRGAKPLGPEAVEVVTSAYWTVYYYGEGLGPAFGTFFVGTPSPDDPSVSVPATAIGPGWGYGLVAFLVLMFVVISRNYASVAPPEVMTDPPVDKESEGAPLIEMMSEADSEADAGNARQD